MTELLVGTKKGLFTLQGEDGEFEITARAFAGEPVEFAMRDPRSGRYFSCTTSAFYGPKIFVTDDPAGEWEQAEGHALPEGGETSLERLLGVDTLLVGFGLDDDRVHSPNEKFELACYRKGIETHAAMLDRLAAVRPPR